MTRADFSRRSSQGELMDEPSDFQTFRDCLRDLAAVNRLTLAYRPTLMFLDGLRRAGRLDGAGPVTILDVASGYGDMMRLIARWARARSLAVRLVGLDLNPWSAPAAAAATSHGEPITWVAGDVFDHDGVADVIISSLFTHHLGDADIVRFVDWMEARAAVGWFVNDLHRHALAYYGFGLLAGAMRWHPFVRHDGPVSIARAFKQEDWRGYLAASRAPEGECAVAWRFPFRICVSRVRSR